MHPVVAALIELHDVNLQRQLLAKDRMKREAKVTNAEKALAQYAALAQKAAAEAGEANALIRQYTADLDRCDRAIRENREKQMQAKSNREYLACVNAVEQAKAEKRLREESLKTLNLQVEPRRQAAALAEARRAEVAKQVELAKAEVEAAVEQLVCERRLDAIYAEKRAAVEPKFLETYERLVISNHRMPLMKVDIVTRATPYGNMIGTNQLEMIRLGHLVVDPQSNAILYVEE